MAVSSPASGSVISLFNKTLLPEALKETVFGQMIGDDNVLKQERDLEINRGTSFTTTLGNNLTGTGFGLSTPVDGNAEALSDFTDTISVDQLSQPVEVPTRMNVDQHKIGWEYSETGYNRLRKWTTATFEIWAANQLAGNTATAIGSGSDTIPYDGRTYPAGKTTLATGNNTATAPSTNRIIRAGGAATDQVLTSSDVFTLSLIDAAVEKARTATPVIEPVRYEGNDVFICLISTEQMTDLRRDTTSAVQFVDISLSLLNGGQDPFSNPLLKTTGILYNNTIIIENTRVPYGVNSSSSAQISTVRRALFLGKQAACFGYKGSGAGEAMFHEEYKDGGRYLQITANLVGGLKKTVFNSEDYATVVISTYAAPHTS